MEDDPFTEPEESADEWVDVRMTDPDEGEWDVDAVVLGGQVEYVDLRIRPELLASFVDCLVDDLGDRRAREVLSNVADSQGIDVPADTGDIEAGSEEGGR